ncbi:MAG: response regulator [Deltaproteobacteria bacterium]|nr:response regulator [Deltaproteobacteria bacterium]
MERKSILIVERGPKMRGALATLFSESGYETAAVATCAEALAELKQKSFDVVVTEVDLDGPSGFDVVRSAREINPQLAVIVLTAAEDVSYAIEALRVGANDFFIKQRDGIDDLKAAVARASRAPARTSGDGAASVSEDLLADIDELNEGFLKNMIALDKEVSDLRDQIAGGPGGDADDSYRVLVVDDEEIILNVLEDLLTGEGMAVKSVGSAEEAVDMLAKERFHLVVTDKNLPKMTGLELIRHLKTQYNGIEAIMITGYASMESAVQALDYGAAGYLLKPFSDIRIILDKIAEVRKRQTDRTKARRYFESFKKRNEQFLERYRAIKTRIASAGGE